MRSMGCVGKEGQRTSGLMVRVAYSCENVPREQKSISVYLDVIVIEFSETFSGQFLTPLINNKKIPPGEDFIFVDLFRIE